VARLQGCVLSVVGEGEASQLLRLSRTDTDRLPAFAAMYWDKALGWLHRRAGTELAASGKRRCASR